MTDKEQMEKVGRLALRVEDDTWVAYYAENDTMEGALWLGAIHMRLVQDEPRKSQWIGLMRECFADMMEAVAGVRPEFPDGVQPAPEHERKKD